MDKSTIIPTLRQHEPELKAAGVKLCICTGLMHRHPKGSDSRPSKRYRGIGRRSGILTAGKGAPGNQLAHLLGVKVDLAPPRSLQDGIRVRAARGHSCLVPRLPCRDTRRSLQDIGDAVARSGHAHNGRAPHGHSGKVFFTLGLRSGPALD
jgi:hypothetical protein